MGIECMRMCYRMHGTKIVDTGVNISVKRKEASSPLRLKESLHHAEVSIKESVST